MQSTSAFGVALRDADGHVVDWFRPSSMFLSRWDWSEDFLTRKTGDMMMPPGGTIEIFAS